MMVCGCDIYMAEAVSEKPAVRVQGLTCNRYEIVCELTLLYTSLMEKGSKTVRFLIIQRGFSGDSGTLGRDL